MYKGKMSFGHFSYMLKLGCLSEVDEIAVVAMDVLSVLGFLPRILSSDSSVSYARVV